MVVGAGQVPCFLAIGEFVCGRKEVVIISDIQDDFAFLRPENFHAEENLAHKQLL